MRQRPEQGSEQGLKQKHKIFQIPVNISREVGQAEAGTVGRMGDKRVATARTDDSLGKT